MRPLRMTKTLTSGNPAKLIFLFTIPLLIGNLFQQFYNMADTLIVGRTLGVEALAAVGCTGGLMFFILGFVIGFTAGLAIITAQRFGAGRKRAVRRSFAVCILLSAAATVLLTAVSVVFARPVLELLQTPPEILDAAHSYIIIIFWGIGAAMLFNLLSNVIRALGDSRTPLYFLVLACVLNIALDLALILRFGMGPAGAAVATVVSQLVSGLLCTIYVFRKFPMLRLTRADWNMSRRYLWAHIRLALPMGFQASIIAIGAILVQFALNRLGAQAVAAFSAAQKIDMVATLPMMSFGIAMATYVAQNYGARNPLRIRQGVLQCSLMSVGFSIAVAVVNIIWGPELIRLFVGTGEREVVRLAQTYLNINASMYWVCCSYSATRFRGWGRALCPPLRASWSWRCAPLPPLSWRGTWVLPGPAWRAPPHGSVPACRSPLPTSSRERGSHSPRNSPFPHAPGKNANPYARRHNGGRKAFFTPQHNGGQRTASTPPVPRCPEWLRSWRTLLPSRFPAIRRN